MTNPYASPGAAVADNDSDERYQPRIFSTQGRIGRIRYLAYSSIVTFLLAFALGIIGALALPALAGSENNAAIMVVLGLVYIPIVAGSLIMTKRRLNDLDKSGWLSLLMLVPFVNFFLALYVVFWPGSAGSNSYGPKPIPNSGWLILFALIPALIGVLAAISIPAYQKYQQKAAAANERMQQLQELQQEQLQEFEQLQQP
ncbi:MAG: DUF805 domain-containing protein [Moraxellaceae bacterium]|nr:DUF805 domain-containing protein [Moraxellaceae bacterium]